MPLSLPFSNLIAELIAKNVPINPFVGSGRFIALHHSDPTCSCIEEELVGDNYARVIVPVSIVDITKGKGIINSENIIFPEATGTKDRLITHGSIWDSIEGGFPLTYGALGTPVQWKVGHSLSLPVNAFVQLIRNKM